MAIDLKLIDKLLADYKKPEDIIGENGLLKQLTKALLERAMQAEITEHLGYEKHDPAGHNSGYASGCWQRKWIAWPLRRYFASKGGIAMTLACRSSTAFRSRSRLAGSARMT
jgi:hypothetical protein